MASCADEEKNRADYAEAKSAQGFFKELIESVMAGKTDEFRDSLCRYLETRPHINAEDVIREFQSEGKTVLHLASSSGHVDILRCVLAYISDKRSFVNIQDKDGFSPLIYATISESIECIRELVSSGADVNLANKDGAAPIHFAAGDGSLDRASFLIENGANTQLVSNSGSALHWAAGKGQSEMIKLLVSKGLPINARNASGLTAVLMSAVACSDESCAALVDAGADVGDIVSGNLTVLHICAEYGLAASVRSIVATEVGKRCLGIQTEDGNLPIHLAAMSGHRDIVQSIFEDSKPLLAGAGFDSVDAIMQNGILRMEEWNAKHAATQKTSDVRGSTFRFDDSLIAEAKSPVDAADAERLKSEGNSFFKDKNYQKAIDSYSSALKKQGNSAVIWSNRSACYLAMGNAEAALFDAEVCRRLDPKWPKGCFRLASARLALKFYEDAAVAAFEGCKLDDSNQELKDLLKKAVALGQEEHRGKNKS